MRIFNQSSQLFSFSLFSRVNPILGPRRRAATAHKWVEAAQRAAQWLLNADKETAMEWAAQHLLDEGSAIMLPEGYPTAPEGYHGTLRRHAADCGGVEASVLTELAKFILRQWDNPGHMEQMEQKARLWAILYPHTGNLVSESVESILSEWEFSYSEDDGRDALERLLGCGPESLQMPLYHLAPIAKAVGENEFEGPDAVSLHLSLNNQDDYDDLVAVRDGYATEWDCFGADDSQFLEDGPYEAFLIDESDRKIAVRQLLDLPLQGQIEVQLTINGESFCWTMRPVETATRLNEEEIKPMPSL